MIATLERPRDALRGVARGADDPTLPDVVGLMAHAGGAGLAEFPEMADVLDFGLPPELEAREPPEARGLARDEVRLLVSFRATDDVAHARFLDLPDYLQAGDLVVVNDSATLPAALVAHTAAGRAVALHLSTRVPEAGPPGPPILGGAGRRGGVEREYHYVVEPREHAGTAGEALALPGAATATLLVPYRGSRRLWVARLALPEPLVPYLHRWGRPIAYPYVRGSWPLAAYQTVYAGEPGSAEMPSAGRPFSARVLARMRARGIGLARITLHTGVASLEHDDPPYPEEYAVPAETAAAIAATRAAGGRVVAVGTTVIRALESAADSAGQVRATRGWTDLVITPTRGVRTVDALLTGFHEPRASHLAMLEAVAGRAHLAIAYQAALAGRYLWHEFGDLHLILGPRAQNVAPREERALLARPGGSRLAAGTLLAR